MEANKILQSGFLDILFEGRNKLYGAYDLRKTYNQRISKALVITLLSVLLLPISLAISKKLTKSKPLIPMIAADLNPQKIAPHKLKALPKLRRHLHTAAIKYTKPVIAKEVVIPPPNIHQIETATIDIKTVAGPKPGIGIINPPAGLTGANRGATSENKILKKKPFIPIVMEARFPGGEKAWQKYIQRAIEAHLDEFSDYDYGTCIVNFIVDTNGNVSNVEATTMKGTMLAEIAVNTIRNGPKWIPAIQNGHYVTAARLQPVTLLNPNQ